MTGLHSFDCGVGSYFGHRRVSQSPPMIPDGRFSRVRFEVAAAPPYVFRPLFKFKPWSAYPLSGNAFTDSLAMYRLPRWLLPQNHLGPGTYNSATYPEVLCSESVTSPSSLLRPHVPVRGPLTGCAFGSFGESAQLRPPAAGPPDLPDVISANLSLVA